MNWFDRKARPWLAENLGPHCAYGHLAAESAAICLLEENNRQLAADLEAIVQQHQDLEHLRRRGYLG